MRRWVCRTPPTTFRSITSVPTTAGLWGLGYFRHTAWVTVSQGWLRGENEGVRAGELSNHKSNTWKGNGRYIYICVKLSSLIREDTGTLRKKRRRRERSREISNFPDHYRRMQD